MPIRFDRFPLPNGDIPSPRPGSRFSVGPIQPTSLPAVPNIPSAPAAPFGLLAESITDATHAVTGALERRKKLEDHNLLAERYMQAATEMDNVYLGLQQNPDQHEQAPDVLKKSFEGINATVLKGVNPEVELALRRELLPKQLEYFHKAQQLKSAAALDRANATVLTSQQRLADEASRLDKTDEDAFADLRPRIDPETGTVAPSRFEELLNGYRAIGLKEEQKAKILEKTRESTAYARALRIAVDDPQRLVNLAKREDAQRGSTFLNYVDPTKRSELLSTAKDRVKVLQRDVEHAQDRAREDMTRSLTEQRSQMTAELFKRSNDRTLTPAYLETARDLQLVTPEHYDHFRRGLQTDALEGGPGNPAVIRRLGEDIYTTTDPVKTRSEILAAGRRGDLPFKTEQAYLAHVESKVKALETAPLTMKDKHEKAQTLFKEALRIQGPMAQQFSVPAQQVLTSALEELDRNAQAGFPNDPLDIYFRKKNEYMARLGVPAVARLADIKKQLRANGHANIDDPKQRVLDLTSRQNSFASRDAFLAEVRRLKDLEDLESQIQRFTDAAKIGAQTPQANKSSNTPSNAPSSKPPAAGTPPVPLTPRK